MIEGAAQSDELEALTRSLANAGMEAQIFASQMGVVMAGSPNAAEAIIEGELGAEDLVEKTEGMYKIENPEISDELRHKIAEEAIRNAKENLQTEQ